MSQMGEYTEVSKLVGTGAIGNARQGWSVKLSEDGNFLFVAGYNDNEIGAVWFFQKISGVWTQKQKIVPTGHVGSTVWFGYSFAVNPSMTTLIVGAYGDNSNVGASFVFTFNDTTWTQQDKLVGDNVTGTYGSYQGQSVALSADANTAIVGGSSDGNGVGAAWIFVRAENSWSQQGSKLVGNGAISDSRQGIAVVLTSDGNLAVVGGFYDQTGIGAIWVHLRSGTSWNQVGTKMTATGEIGQGYFANSLALSGDDQTLVVGGQADNSRLGAAWIFKRNGNTFTQFGNKLVGIGAIPNSWLGQSVAVNKVGTLVAVGAHEDSMSVGAVYMYYFDGTQYKQLGNKIVATDAIGVAFEGWSVSLDASGSQLLFGGWNDNGGAGAAWIYSSPNIVPTLTTTKPTSAFSSTSSGAFLSLVTVIPVLVFLLVALMYFFFRVYKKQTNKEEVEIKNWIDGNKGEITLHGKNYNGEDNDDDDEDEDSDFEVTPMDNPLQTSTSSKRLSLNV